MAGRPRGGGHDHQLTGLLTFFDFSIFFFSKDVKPHPFTLDHFLLKSRDFDLFSRYVLVGGSGPAAVNRPPLSCTPTVE